MKHHRCIRVSVITIAVGTIALLAVTPVWSGDWPQFGGANSRNMVSGEKGIPDSFDPGTPSTATAASKPARNVKWAVKLGKEAYGNTAVAGGRVFVGTDNAYVRDARLKGDRDVLLCLDEKTGTLNWQLALTKGKGGGLPGIGICSHPTIDGDRVYIITNRLEILCLDVNGQANGNDGPFKDEAKFFAADANDPIEVAPGDADIIWRTDAMAEFKGMTLHDCAGGCVMIQGDLAFVTISTANSKKKEPAPTLLVLDKKTGTVVAREYESIIPYHNQWTCPAAGKVGDKTLVFFAGDNGVCYAFDAQPVAGQDGRPGRLKTVWTFDCSKVEPALSLLVSPRKAASGPATTLPATPTTAPAPFEMFGTPVYHNNHVFVARGRDPTLSGNDLAVGRLLCINAAGSGDITGSGLIWSFDKIAASMSTVAVADDLLYVADLKGGIYCLDERTGKLHWEHHLRAGTEIWGSPLIADGKVYVGAGAGRKNGGELLVFAQGKEKKLLSEVKLDKPACITPVAANGVLYVATCGMLYAIESRK